MVDTIQRPVIVPKIEIFEQRAAWRQVLGDRAPLAARAQDVHQAVHDFTDIDAPLAPTMLGRRYQGRNMGPFFVRHVTRIAKLAAIIGTTIFRCPHRSYPPMSDKTLESHPTHMIQQLFGRTLSWKYPGSLKYTRDRCSAPSRKDWKRNYWRRATAAICEPPSSGSARSYSMTPGNGHNP